MKMRYAFLSMSFLLIATALLADAPLPPAEFGKLSLEDAARAIDAVDINNRNILGDFAASAIESKRSELLKLCFENNSVNFAFDYAVSKMPDSPYKEELMLMMLKNPSLFWDRHADIQRYPGHLNIDKTSAPFRALIGKYLPNQPIDDGMIATRETRSRLAEKIETVRKAIHPHDPATASPPSPTVVPSTSSPSPKVAESPAPVVERKSPPWPWVVGIAVATMLVLLALKRRG